MSCGWWVFWTMVWFTFAGIEWLWIYRFRHREGMANTIIRIRQEMFDEAHAEAERIVAEATEYKKRVLRGEDT